MAAIRPHRRAKIIDALAEMFATLKEPAATTQEEIDAGKFPIQVKTVQKRFVHWTALDKQDALPAILISYGDGGDAPDSDVIGFIDELFPIACRVLMKENDTERGALTDQASDIHYSIGSLVNSNPTLGVEGVNPDKTRIRGWRGGEGDLGRFEMIRFRVQIEHRYHASENV